MVPFENVTVTKIKELFTVFSPKGRQETIRRRASFGLSFCTEGRIVYTCGGEDTLSDEHHAVLLPKGQSYTLRGEKTGKFPVINFDAVNLPCDRVLSFPIQNAAAYCKDFEKMKALSLFEGNRALLMSIFYAILHRLFTEGSEKNRLFPALRYLEKHLGDPALSNSVLAKQCNISEVYFRKSFQKAYGVTPRQYLIDARIGMAKQLLEEGVSKVGAIAEQCGFPNPYHFCRTFKERTGFTPTEYGKQNRYDVSGVLARQLGE